MPRFAANLEWLFTERPPFARLEAALAAGFSAVELPRPYGPDLAELRAELDRLGLTPALIETPGAWAERLNVAAGRAGGAVAAETFTRNLRYAAARAAERAPTLILTIEPLNSRDAPGCHLASTEQALGVLDQVGAENVKLLLDFYHCQIMEGDLSKKIEALAPLIGHVQIASAPDRAEPDHGEVHYPHLFALLDRVGYGGWVGCEYRPRGDTEAGLTWFEPYRSVGMSEDI